MIVLLSIGLMACEGIFFLAGPFPCSFSSIDTSNVQNVVRKDLRTEEIMNTTETKSILHEANITDHLNLASRSITQEELQRDYNYYRAQKFAGFSAFKNWRSTSIFWRRSAKIAQ